MLTVNDGDPLLSSCRLYISVLVYGKRNKESGEASEEPASLRFHVRIPNEYVWYTAQFQLQYTADGAARSSDPRIPTRDLGSRYSTAFTGSFTGLRRLQVRCTRFLGFVSATRHLNLDALAGVVCEGCQGRFASRPSPSIACALRLPRLLTRHSRPEQQLPPVRKSTMSAHTHVACACACGRPIMCSLDASRLHVTQHLLDLRTPSLVSVSTCPLSTRSCLPPLKSPLAQESVWPLSDCDRFSVLLLSRRSPSTAVHLYERWPDL